MRRGTRPPLYWPTPSSRKKKKNNLKSGKENDSTIKKRKELMMPMTLTRPAVLLKNKKDQPHVEHSRHGTKVISGKKKTKGKADETPKDIAPINGQMVNLGRRPPFFVSSWIILRLISRKSFLWATRHALVRFDMSLFFRWKVRSARRTESDSIVFCPLGESCPTLMTNLALLIWEKRF